MRTSLRRSVLLVPTLAVAALALAGCTKDVNPPPTTASFTKDAETVTVEMTSPGKTTYKVGPDGEFEYGQNKLEGKATVMGQPATVEILGNVEYLKGSGPFYGFLTVKWDDGSLLGFNLQGRATALGGGGTGLKADARFLGGAGQFVDATAAARFVGGRDGAVGAPIIIKLMIDVKKNGSSSSTSTTAKATTTTASPASSSTSAAPSSTTTTTEPTTTTEAPTTTDAPTTTAG